MKTIFGLTLKSAARDPFLLFWSILLPVGGTIGLGLLIDTPKYPLRIMTGMMAAGTLFYAFTTAVFAILAQRRRGVYRLLRVTPMPLWRYIVSVSSAWTFVAICCAVLVLTAGTTVFSLGFNVISIPMLFLVLLIAALAYVLFSFSVSSLCRTEGHASMVTNIISMPLLFCSDAFYSMEGAPAWLQAITHLNPFQWLTNGVRSALALDAGGWLTSTGLLLAAFAVALLFAVRTFRFTDA